MDKRISLRGRVIAVFLVGVGGVLAGFAGRAEAAPIGATATVSRHTQFVGVAAPYTFSVKNTGTSAVKRVQIATPTGFKPSACTAPSGYTQAKTATACTFTANATLAPNATQAFTMKVTTPARSTDVAGVFKVGVSTAASGAFTAATAGAVDGLGTKAHVFEITNVGVSSAAPAVGTTPCPTAHTANTNATVFLVVCGRNRGNVALTPQAANSTATGTLLASPGTFNAASLPKTAGSPVVLGVWHGARTSATAGTASLTATIGSSATASSAPIVLQPYTLSGVTDPVTAVNDTAAASENGAPVVINVRANDTGAGLTVTVAGTPSAGGTAQISNGGADITFNPNGAFEDLGAGQTRQSSFGYTISGTGGATSSATVTVTVTGTNDAPSVAVSGTTSYAEQTPAAAIVTGLTLTDVDSTTMSGGSVAITAGLLAGDELVFTNQNGITGSYSNGLLTLTGTTTAANYQQALASVAFRNLTNDNPAGSRTIEYSVNDGAANSNTATRVFPVTGVNDAPTVTLASGAVNYNEQAPATPITGTALSLADLDSANLASATVRIAAGLVIGDELVFTNQNGITGSYSFGSGTLTLTGSSSVANYQTALRSVTFRNGANDNPAGNRTVSFVVNDGTATSNAPTRVVVVSGVNDAPTVTLDAGATTYNEQSDPIQVSPNATVSDPDTATATSASARVLSGFVTGDQLLFSNQNGITGSYNAATGVLNLSGSTTMANYQAALRSIYFANQTSNSPGTSRSITFAVNDGTTLSNSPIRDITVVPTNDVPFLTVDSGMLSYDEQASAITISPNLTVADDDNELLAGATVRISGGLFSGDELVFTDQSGISGSYAPKTGVLTLTGNATVARYQGALRSIGFHNPTNNNAGGDRTISFTVNDGTSSSNSPTRMVAVTGINDAPVVTLDAGAVDYAEQAPAVLVSPTMTVSDFDNGMFGGATVRVAAGFYPGDELVFTNQNGITGSYNTGNFTLTLSGTATVADYRTALRSVQFRNLTHNNPVSDRVITFSVHDGEAASNEPSRIVRVTGVNDAPTLSGIESTAISQNNGAETQITSSLVVADVDSTRLSSATVRIQSGLIPEDELVFENQNGISGSYNRTTGVLTLSGSATVAEYQAALRSITFRNTLNTMPAGTRTITFQVNDGALLSNTQSRSVVITDF